MKPNLLIDPEAFIFWSEKDNAFRVRVIFWQGIDCAKRAADIIIDPEDIPLSPENSLLDVFVKRRTLWQRIKRLLRIS